MIANVGRLDRGEADGGGMVFERPEVPWSGVDR